KNPISSSTSEIRITATNVSVAFHTIPQTVATSPKLTTPKIRATSAPAQEDHPMPSPFGCLMTRNKVTRNMIKAITAVKLSISSMTLLHILKTADQYDHQFQVLL